MRMRTRRAQRATGLVEYGVVLAAAAVLIIAGLSSFNGAVAGYFSTLGKSVAPPPPSVSTGPRHSTQLALACAPGVIIIQQPYTCTANVQDTSALVQGLPPGLAQPPAGKVTLLANGVPVAACASVTMSASDTSRCVLSGLPLTTPGSVTIVANYDPQGANFLASAGQTAVMVLAPTPTAVPNQDHGPPCSAPGAAISTVKAGIFCVPAPG